MQIKHPERQTMGPNVRRGCAAMRGYKTPFTAGTCCAEGDRTTCPHHKLRTALRRGGWRAADPGSSAASPNRKKKHSRRRGNCLSRIHSIVCRKVLQGATRASQPSRRRGEHKSTCLGPAPRTPGGRGARSKKHVEGRCSPPPTPKQKNQKSFAGLRMHKQPN